MKGAVCITMPNCPKCRQAKEKLKDYEVKFVDHKSPEGLYWMEMLKPRYAPFFIYGDEDTSMTTHSILKVRDYFEEVEDKQE